MKTPFKLVVFVLLLASLLSGCVGMQLAPQNSNVPVSNEASPVEETLPALPPTDETNPVEADPDPETPGGVAVLFFQAYVEASEKMLPTLGSPEFEAQKYLSEEYVSQVAEIKAGFDGGGFDPVTGLQMIPPAPVEIKEVQEDGDQAEVTLQFGRGLMETPWEKSVSLARIDGQWKIVPDRVDGGGLSPEEAAQAFYSWYLEYIGSGEEIRNPIVDQAYRAAPYLSMNLIGKVDRMIAEEGGLHFDPFLCAQDIPTEVKPSAVYYNDARPIVVLDTSFPGHHIIADMVRVGFDTWAIQDITCGSSPEGVAKAFYAWTLGYMTGRETFRNPWVDGAYQESGYLSQGFIENLDELLSSEEPFGADPVLFTQDLPQAFSVESCPEENCAYVNLQFGNMRVNRLRVETVSEDGSLRVASISHPEGPASAAPEGTAAGVSSWLPFTDEQYGYSLQVPAGWDVSGLKVTDLHKAEEFPLMRTINLRPSAEEKLTFFSLDVFVGGREVLPIGDSAAETIEINGNAGEVYQSDWGSVYYLFPHPTLENTWILFTDNISQYPGREDLAGSVDGVMQAILSTLTFSK